MLRRFPQHHRQPGATAARHGRRVFVPAGNQLAQAASQPRLNPPQIASVPGADQHIVVAHGQVNGVAGAGGGNGRRIGQVVERCGAGLAPFLNEQARQLPFLHRAALRVMPWRRRLFQARQVLAGDFVVGSVPE